MNCCYRRALTSAERGGLLSMLPVLSKSGEFPRVSPRNARQPTPSGRMSILLRGGKRLRNLPHTPTFPLVPASVALRAQDFDDEAEHLFHVRSINVSAFGGFSTSFAFAGIFNHGDTPWLQEFPC